MSTTPVTAGEELTYMVTFTNDGEATGEVDRVDDLSHILDDADLISGPDVSDVALAASGPDGDGLVTAVFAVATGATEVVVDLEITGEGREPRALALSKEDGCSAPGWCEAPEPSGDLPDEP